MIRDEDLVILENTPEKKKKKLKLEMYRFSCESPEEKKSWMADIEEAIRVNKLISKVGDGTHSRGGTVRVRSKDIVVEKKKYKAVG